MIERHKTLFRWLFRLPFLIGTVGFLLNGAPPLDAMYGAISLYVLNLNVGYTGGILFEIARWTAPLATASGILFALRNVFSKARQQAISRLDDATAIYCDEGCDLARCLGETLPHAVISLRRPEGCEFFAHPSRQILMFDSEWDSLDFYHDHRAELDDCEVFVRLTNADALLLRETEVRYFNPANMVASLYWTERSVLDFVHGKRLQAQIAIVGFDTLGQQLLGYALMRNVFFSDQHIVYHVFGDSSVYRHLHENVELLNNDEVIFHDENWECALDLLRRMDRVIVAQTDASQIVQGLLYTCPDVQIDFYNPDDTDFSQFYKTDALTAFGMTAQLFSDRNSNDAIAYYLAKHISYQVARPDAASPRDNRGNDQPDERPNEQPNKQFEARVNDHWHSLDGFTRASYLAFVEYHALRRRLADKLAEQGLSFADEELGETEHIRWARFYTLNHWECGATARSEAEDFNHRVYACLAPYSQISAEDRERELARIKALAEKAAHEMLVPDRRRNRHRGTRAPWSRG